MSGIPVRNGNGQLNLREFDLSASGFGSPWHHTRGYGNRTNISGINGNRWQTGELPQLGFRGAAPGNNNPAGVFLRTLPNRGLLFRNQGGGQFTPATLFRGELAHDPAAKTFVFTDPQGTQRTFYDNSTEHPAALRGQLKELVDPYGKRVEATYNGAQQMAKVEWKGDSGESERWDYRYVAAGPNTGQLEEVCLSVNEKPVRRSCYKYYGMADTGGNLNDLQEAAVEEFDANAKKWKTLRRQHYRYYKAGDAGGFAGGMKFAVGSEAYDRMKKSGLDPLTASDAQVAKFADAQLEYDAQQRVTSEKTRDGADEWTFAYESNPTPGGDSNTWRSRTTIDLPDGNQHRIYANARVSQLVTAIEAKAGALGNKWYTAYTRNAQGWMTQKASPAAVSSVTEPTPGNPNLQVNLRTQNGRIDKYEYYDNTDPAEGAVKGRFKKNSVSKGTAGEVKALRKLKWSLRSVTRSPVATIATVEEEQVFPTGQESEPVSTSTTLTYYQDEDGNDTFQVKERVTHLPVIPVTQNGDGQAHTRTEIFDEYGNKSWNKDARGFITHRQYDLATNALKRLIRDVDTTRVEGAPDGWATPAGGGLNLVTDYEFDDQGRTTKKLGPAHEVQLHEDDAEPTVVRTVAFTVYRDDIRETWRARGYATGNAPSYGYETVGPVTITRRDGNGNVIDVIQSKRKCTCGPLKTNERFPQCNWVRWIRNFRDQWGRLTETRAYFKIPANGEGLESENYNATRFGYNELGRQVVQTSPGGTITRWVYDTRSLVTERWVGTNDNGATNADPSGGGAAGNNMKQVLANEYDGGQAGGDGNLTKQTLKVDDVAANNRVAEFSYDFRNRLDETKSGDGTTDFFVKNTYDNTDRITEVTRYHTSVVDANRTGLSKTFWDDQNRIYKSETYAVAIPAGTVGNALRDEAWYDPDGNAIKQINAGSEAVTKLVYDGLARQTHEYIGYNPSGSSNDNNVTGDTIVEQNESAWDPASNLILSTNWRRFHDSTGTGALNGPNDAQPKARRTYVANYPDPIGRLRVTADFGTNGGADLVRPGVAPKAGDAVLVSMNLFGEDGQGKGSIDPMGTEARWKLDHLGRQIQLIENFVASCCEAPGTKNQAPNTKNPKPDENRTSEYAYHADGGLERLTLINNITGDQVTRWIYGTTLSDSQIATSYLLRAKIYPESDDAAAPLGDGPDGVYERLEYSYNRMTNLVQFKDPNGTIHAYDFDKLGRQTQDRVTTFASHIDQAVKRIANTYDLRGLLEKVTSFDSVTVGSGTVVNEVALDYNGFGQLVKDNQAHSGAVDANTPFVGYAFADASSGNTARMSALTYPNGRIVDYGYGTTNGANDLLSRVETLTIQGEATAACRYTYAGLDWYPKIEYPEPGVELTYIKDASQPVGDAGDDYIGFDRFGRTVDMNWRKTVGGSELDHIQYGYNRASNRTWRKNLVATSSQDEAYQYDGLYQLSDFARGDLNINHTLVCAVPKAKEHFTYDPTGNWQAYVQKSDGTTDLDQSRANNKDNQITQIDGSSDRVAHDKAGNTTQMPPDASGDWSKSLTLTWDAWNRIVEVEDEATEVGAYQYDGLYRRTTKTVSSVTRHHYYSNRWKPLEERIDASTDAERQYLWGARPNHRDELILRDRKTGALPVLDERLYCAMDYFSPTAVFDKMGVVLERYGFSGFGIRRVMAPDFSERTSSSFEVAFGFQGQFLDETSSYNFGYRTYNPPIGRWFSRDPIQEIGGSNLYLTSLNNTLLFIDKFGLDVANWGQHMNPAKGGSRGNCWRYAANDPLTDIEQAEFRKSHAQGEWRDDFQKLHDKLPPGFNNQGTDSCDSLMSGLLGTEGVEKAKDDGSCCEGYNLVSVQFANENKSAVERNYKNPQDYHFARQLSDGTWGQKVGHYPEQKTKGPVSDASEEQGYVECGKICIKDGLDVDKLKKKEQGNSAPNCN